MSEAETILRKNIDRERMPGCLSGATDVDYWRSLNPRSTIGAPRSSEPVEKLEIDPGEYAAQLGEEGYFQTDPIIPTPMIESMRNCVESVRAARLPPAYALVYDVFYDSLRYSHALFTSILGPGYRLIPNFWVYYVETSDDGKGFEPHRDTEYGNTVDGSGMPSVLTFRIPITDATPLNSCIYLLPANRARTKRMS